MEIATSMVYNRFSSFFSSNEDSTTPGQAVEETPSGEDAATQKPLKERLWQYLRATPSVIALTGLVLAIVCALVWKQKVLAGIFGGAALLSIYPIHLSCQFDDLKSLGETSVELKTSVKTLQDHIEYLKKENDRIINDLKDKLSRMEQSVEAFDKANKKLEKSVETLNSENQGLTVTKDNLAKEVQDLTSLKTQFTNQIEILDDLNKSLVDIGNSTSENHQQFNENLTGFNTQIQKMQEDFSKKNSEVSSTVAKQLEALVQTGNMLSKIFSDISKWKESNAVVSQSISNMQEINRMKEQSVKEQKQLQEQLVKLREEIALSQGQVKQMELIKQGFDESLSQLQTQVIELSQKSGEYKEAKQLVIQVAKVIEGYQQKRLSQELPKEENMNPNPKKIIPVQN